MKYIYQQKAWPNFSWNSEELQFLLGNVRALQGRLSGKLEALGFPLKEEAILSTLSMDILKSNEIEGEILSDTQVRSSVARRLGMNVAGMVPSTSFDFTSLADPTTKENIEEPNGRGVFLMHKPATKVTYLDHRRIVNMEFKLKRR